MLNVIVKVGKRSNLILRNAVVNRAITLGDIKYSKEIDVLVLEGLRKDEVAEAREIVNKLIDNGVYVVGLNTDDNVKLDNIEYLDSKVDLYRKVEEKTGVEIGRTSLIGLVEDRIEDTIELTDSRENDYNVDSTLNTVENYDIEGVKGVGENNEFESGEIEVVENEVDKEESEEVSEEIEVVKFLKEKLRGSIEKINQLKDVNLVVENERRELEKRLLEYEKLELDLKGELEVLREEKEGMANRVHELEKLTTEQNNKELAIFEKEEELKVLREEIERLKIDVDIKTKELEELKIDIEEVRLREKSLLEDLEVKKESEELFKLKNVELEDKLREKQDVLTDKELRITELENQLEELNIKVRETSNIVEERVREVRDELIQKSNELEQYKVQVRVLDERLLASDTKYNELSNMCGVDISGANILVENNKTLEGLNKNLINQVNMLKEELNREIKARGVAESNRNLLEEQNNNLKVTVKALTVGATGVGAGMRLSSINYTGRGFIIPVFGAGSFGITTTAYTLAKKLSEKNKVLFVDFDMVSAKADAFFKLKPIVDIVGLNMGTKSTGLGLFVEKGFNFFMQNVHKMILKGEGIDYISGFYVRPDVNKLVTADFTSFFNYCGNSYDYVVIDFGRLGSSEMSDQMLAEVCKVAFKCVVVTLNSNLELRNFRLKMNELRLELTKVVWLLNMVENTKIEDRAVSLISPARYGFMEFSEDIRGKAVEFSRERRLRDRFNKFFDLIMS